jgi:hypothetical protein
MSRGTVNNVLSTIHHLAETGNLVESTGGAINPSCVLPRDIRSLESRADGNVYLDFDTNLHMTSISQVELGQTRQVVNVWKTNVVDVLQTYLLDPSFPPGSLYLQRRGEKGNEYVSANGEKLRHFEAYTNDRWNDLLETIPVGTYLLAVAIHSDGVAVGDRSHYPWSITVVNFPFRFRTGRFGLSKFGFAEKPHIRKPRNSRYSEHLGQYQKDCKNALTSRIAAEVLADLEFAAQNPLVFAVRNLDGSVREIPCSVRLHHAQQDIEELLACNGVSGHICNECCGVQKAMSAGAGGAGTKNRPFLHTSQAGMCATAELRSPEKYIRQQAAFMLMERRYGKTVAEGEAKKVRVRYRVPNALIRLANLMPHGKCRGPFGINGLDSLHSLRTGAI